MQTSQQVVVTRPMVNSSVIDDNDSQFRCCCGSMHVRIGAIVIGIVEIVGVLLQIIFSGVQVNQAGNVYTVIGYVISGIITIIVVGLMFYGIKKERAAFVIPHLVYQILAMIALAILAVLSLLVVLGVGIALSSQASKGGQEGRDAQAVGTALAIVSIVAVIYLVIAAVLKIWFFVIILKLYRYLKMKEMAAGHFVNPSVQYVNQQPPMNVH